MPPSGERRPLHCFVAPTALAHELVVLTQEADFETLRFDRAALTVELV